MCVNFVIKHFNVISKPYQPLDTILFSGIERKELTELKPPKNSRKISKCTT